MRMEMKLIASGIPDPYGEGRTIETCPVCDKESSMYPKGLHEENDIICPWCGTQMVFIYEKVKLTRNQKRNRRKKDRRKK